MCLFLHTQDFLVKPRVMTVYKVMKPVRNFPLNPAPRAYASKFYTGCAVVGKRMVPDPIGDPIVKGTGYAGHSYIVEGGAIHVYITRAAAERRCNSRYVIVEGEALVWAMNHISMEGVADWFCATREVPR